MALWKKITQDGAALRGRRIFAAVAMIAVVSVVVAAQGFSGASARGGWRRGQSAADPIETARQALQRGSPWLDLLRISDEQRVELRQVVDRHEAALRQLESDRNRLNEAFSSAFAVDVLNPEDIERARTEARALGERAIDESIVMVMEAVRILTPEQRTRLVALWRAH
jgi:Spy/CpxP family protein refolding chaperone